jgi:hypothetical protein
LSPRPSHRERSYRRAGGGGAKFTARKCWRRGPGDPEGRAESRYRALRACCAADALQGAARLSGATRSRTKAGAPGRGEHRPTGGARELGERGADQRAGDDAGEVHPGVHARVGNDSGESAQRDGHRRQHATDPVANANAAADWPEGNEVVDGIRT